MNNYVYLPNAYQMVLLSYNLQTPIVKALFSLKVDFVKKKLSLFVYNGESRMTSSQVVYAVARRCVSECARKQLYVWKSPRPRLAPGNRMKMIEINQWVCIGELGSQVGALK
jgi:hypothetical protein